MPTAPYGQYFHKYQVNTARISPKRREKEKMREGEVEEKIKYNNEKNQTIPGF